MLCFLQAIQRVNADEECVVEDFRYEIVLEDRYEECCKHIAEHNFPDEPLCISFGLTMSKELKEIILGTIKQNMSIALISSKTNEIVGLRVIRLAKKENKFNPDDFRSTAVRNMLHFFEYINKTSDVFQYYDVDEIFEFFGLSVHRDHRRKGIGLRLMKAAIVFLSSMNIGPAVMKGSCSSNFSKRIYEKLDFEQLLEIKYDDYKVDGETVINNTGQHKSVKMYAKTI